MIKRPLMVNALVQSFRNDPCIHAGGFPWSGRLPCTGQRRCTMCNTVLEDLQAAEEKLLVAMVCRGGSFAIRLGQAWQLADSHNKQTMRKAFGDLLWSFAHWVERDRTGA